MCLVFVVVREGRVVWGVGYKEHIDEVPAAVVADGAFAAGMERGGEVPEGADFLEFGGVRGVIEIAHGDERRAGTDLQQGVRGGLEAAGGGPSFRTGDGGSAVFGRKVADEKVAKTPGCPVPQTDMENIPRQEVGAVV